jgi:hypothetical protein
LVASLDDFHVALHFWATIVCDGFAYDMAGSQNGPLDRWIRARSSNQHLQAEAVPPGPLVVRWISLPDWCGCLSIGFGRSHDWCLIGMVLSAWAAFIFFRGSIAGAPPLYSKGSFERSLHFAAGIIFGSLAIGIALKLAGNPSSIVVTSIGGSDLSPFSQFSPCDTRSHHTRQALTGIMG